MADCTDLTMEVLIFPHKQIEIEREMRPFFGWRNECVRLTSDYSAALSFSLEDYTSVNSFYGEGFGP